MKETEAPAPRSDWSTPLPAVIPRPMFWPAGLAFGLTLLAWGLLTSVVLLVVGGLAFAISLIGWIGELRHEQRET